MAQQANTCSGSSSRITENNADWIFVLNELHKCTINYYARQKAAAAVENEKQLSDCQRAKKRTIVERLLEKKRNSLSAIEDLAPLLVFREFSLSLPPSLRFCCWSRSCRSTGDDSFRHRRIKQRGPFDIMSTEERERETRKNGCRQQLTAAAGSTIKRHYNYHCCCCW